MYINVTQMICNIISRKRNKALKIGKFTKISRLDYKTRNKKKQLNISQTRKIDTTSFCRNQSISFRCSNTFVLTEQNPKESTGKNTKKY